MCHVCFASSICIIDGEVPRWSILFCFINVSLNWTEFVCVIPKFIILFIDTKSHYYPLKDKTLRFISVSFLHSSHMIKGIDFRAYYPPSTIKS